jgi:hypothetical protein
MREVSKNNHQDKWIAGINAKYNNIGDPVSRKYFDDIFEGFDVSLVLALY